MALYHNAAKRALAGGGLSLGFGVHHLRSNAVPMLAAAGGHDHVFIDMEHGAFTMQEATQLCIACLPHGIAPIVRVCAGALDEATRLLDNGALGIVVPHVDTEAQARRIAGAFRYPPIGTRSWGGPPAVYGYLPPDVAQAQAAINAEVLICAMIESEEGVRNVDAIAAVDGIDVLLVGSFDLTADLGIAGQFRHARTEAAIRAVADACRKAGKALGVGGISSDDDCAFYMGLGSRFMTSGNDHSFLVSGSVVAAERLRGMAAAQKPL
ncbi:HpcH/HpaI aldolase family protein [Rhodopila sp.]|jgi:2-keto-3-deoxy-L-rhamnonate aldolase RhmA|uniref:HpcH/HpaI aldolase family protein n=1 Tax=Rhodopila sp. TaxID=2480087 RepID=UPI002B7E7669|nr:aldolase/citrate lyase family protein [Rhodopila sp.]HVZ09104.1 aldolase/citrate lyase family protein [Rhodopila sp.]